MWVYVVCVGYVACYPVYTECVCVYVRVRECAALAMLLTLHLYFNKLQALANNGSISSSVLIQANSISTDFTGVLYSNSRALEYLATGDSLFMVCHSILFGQVIF